MLTNEISLSIESTKINNLRKFKGQRMKNIVISALLVVFMIGCGGNNPKKPTVKVNPKTAIKIQTIIPFQKGVPIAANIKNECKLQAQLSDFITAYSVGEGVGVIQKKKVSKRSKGKNLVVTITNAISSGNAFIGHRKYTSIKGTLYNNGKKKGSFTAARLSGGGAFGGWKGSCSVLGRTIKILGSDVSKWLKKPVNGAHLGDNV